MNIPVNEKYLLNIDEASAYFGIGKCKLRELTNDERCPFVIYVGSKRLINRKKCEKYLDDTYSLA